MGGELPIIPPASFWNVVDPNGYITPDQGQADQEFSWVGPYRNNRAYVYHDYGASFFGDDFDIRVKFTMLESDDQPTWLYLTNDLSKTIQQLQADFDPVAFVQIFDPGFIGDAFYRCGFIDNINTLRESGFFIEGYLPTPIPHYIRFYKNTGVDTLIVERHADSSFGGALESVSIGPFAPKAPGWDFRYLVLLHNDPLDIPAGTNLQYNIQLVDAS